MVNPPIVFTTDFGIADPYAGVMQGVVLGINPRATVVDLTHQIQPQNIQQAAFILGASYRFFPAGSIHVVVVDPGVGTERWPLLLVTPTACFLAPDNGVLSYVVHDYLASAPQQAGRASLPQTLAAYRLANDRYWLHPVSRTFHGRDIFAPVAAHLSLGAPPGDLGHPVADLAFLPVPQPARHGDSWCGVVVYSDHFGNLVTNIPARWLDGAEGILVEIKGRRIQGLGTTFQSPGSQREDGLLALEGSLGYLEIAVRNGSAALTLGAEAGEPVRISASRRR